MFEIHRRESFWTILALNDINRKAQNTFSIVAFKTLNHLLWATLQKNENCAHHHVQPLAPRAKHLCGYIRVKVAARVLILLSCLGPLNSWFSRCSHPQSSWGHGHVIMQQGIKMVNFKAPWRKRQVGITVRELSYSKYVCMCVCVTMMEKICITDKEKASVCRWVWGLWFLKELKGNPEQKVSTMQTMYNSRLLALSRNSPCSLWRRSSRRCLCGRRAWALSVHSGWRPLQAKMDGGSWLHLLWVMPASPHRKQQEEGKCCALHALRADFTVVFNLICNLHFSPKTSSRIKS